MEETQVTTRGRLDRSDLQAVLRRFEFLLANFDVLTRRERSWMKKCLKSAEFVAAYLVKLNSETVKRHARQAKDDVEKALEPATIPFVDDEDDLDPEELEDKAELRGFLLDHAQD